MSSLYITRYKNRNRNGFQRVSVSDCIRDILHKFSFKKPIDRKFCEMFAYGYADEFSGNAGHTVKSVMQFFGEGVYYKGKWSFYHGYMSYERKKAQIYSDTETREEINKPKEMVEIETLRATWGGVKFSYFSDCNYCGVRIRKESGLCRSCFMKERHLNDKMDELAEVKRLTNKLKKVIKDESKRNAKNVN